MAEKEGFEPSVQENLYAGFRTRLALLARGGFPGERLAHGALCALGLRQFGQNSPHTAGPLRHAFDLFNGALHAVACHHRAKEDIERVWNGCEPGLEAGRNCLGGFGGGGRQGAHGQAE